MKDNTDVKKYGCEDIVAIIGEYMDGETDDSTSAAVESHLAGCEGCRAELELRRRLREAIIDAEVPPVPPADLHDRIMAGVRIEAAARRRRLIRRVTAVAASLFLVIGIGTAALMSLPLGDKKGGGFMAPGAADGNNKAEAAEGNNSYNYDGAPGDDGMNNFGGDYSEEMPFDDPFSLYGAGYDGGYVIYAEGKDESDLKELASQFEVDAEKTAVTIPYSEDAMDKVTAFLFADGTDTAANVEHVGDESGDQCIIIFIK